MIFKRIAVVGLGYVGLPTATMSASKDIPVIGVDTNPHVVRTVNQWKIHIVEPGLGREVEAVVTNGFLRATIQPEPADAFVIAVPTPFKQGDNEPDISYIEAATRAFAPVLAPGNLVVLESSSPVGTTEAMGGWLAEERPGLTFPQTTKETADILQPGAGVGGQCIAVDPWFIVHSAPEEAQLIRTARQVNDAKPDGVIQKIQQAIGSALRDSKKTVGEVAIACYGLTFKPDVDDLLESPSLQIVRRLTHLHPGRIVVVEPHIRELPVGLCHARLLSNLSAAATADVNVMLVDHTDFRQTPPPSGLIVDVRGVWK